MGYKVLNTKSYEKSLIGITLLSDSRVIITGEQTIEFADKSIAKVYVYDIEGYEPPNGQSFVSRKENISILN